MYTKPRYSLKDMMRWTRDDTVVFLVIATLPVIVFEVLGQKWLHLPWLPVALIGTAVAFVISFQNNASYDRVWEARKIWGGIVNASRAFGIMVNHFITNEVAKEPASDAELVSIRRDCR